MYPEHSAFTYQGTRIFAWLGCCLKYKKTTALTKPKRPIFSAFFSLPTCTKSTCIHLYKRGTLFSNTSSNGTVSITDFCPTIPYANFSLLKCKPKGILIYKITTFPLPKYQKSYPWHHASGHQILNPAYLLYNNCNNSKKTLVCYVIKSCVTHFPLCITSSVQHYWPLVPVLSQTNPVETLPTYILEIHFNIILPFKELNYLAVMYLRLYIHGRIKLAKYNPLWKLWWKGNRNLQRQWGGEGKY